MESIKRILIIYIADVIAFLTMFFADLTPALYAIGFLIFADTFTGIWASWKNQGKKSITSRKGGRIVAKLILYPLALIVAKVVETYLAPDVPLIKVTLGILSMVEVKSIFEKISDILGFDLWQKIKKALWPDKKNK